MGMGFPFPKRPKRVERVERAVKLNAGTVEFGVSQFEDVCIHFFSKWDTEI